MIPKRGLWRLAAAVLVCTALAGTASAQITTGTVSGTVKDAQGGVIPGATVVLDQRNERHEIRRPSSPTKPATTSSRT